MVKSPCQTKKDTIAVWLSFLDHFPRETYYKYPCQKIYIYIYQSISIKLPWGRVGSNPLPTLKPPLRPFQLPGHANSRHLRTQYSKGCGANSLVPSRAIDPFPPGGVKIGSMSTNHSSGNTIATGLYLSLKVYIYNYIHMHAYIYIYIYTWK